MTMRFGSDYFRTVNLKKVFRIALGLIFVFAGIVKIIDPSQILGIMSKIWFLPLSVIEPAAYSVIILEMMIGALLLIKHSRVALLSASCLLLLFCFVLTYKILTHDPSGCGCFGNVLNMSNQKELANNIVLLTAIIYIY